MSGGFRVKNGIICYLAAEKRALSLFMASVLVSLTKKYSLFLTFHHRCSCCWQCFSPHWAGIEAAMGGKARLEGK